MSRVKYILVVANETLESPELYAALERDARRHAVCVTLLAPAAVHDRTRSRKRLESMTERLFEIGVRAEGSLGDAVAITAVRETWDPARHDEVIVGTLPPELSHWLGIDLAQRIAKLTGSMVRHVPCTVTDRNRHLISA